MGGPDGGGCNGNTNGICAANKRKKREDTKPANETIKRNKSLLSMEKRQTLKIVGNKKKSTKFGWKAYKTFDKTTEATFFAARTQMKRSKRQAG